MGRMKSCSSALFPLKPRTRTRARKIKREREDFREGREDILHPNICTPWRRGREREKFFFTLLAYGCTDEKREEKEVEVEKKRRKKGRREK